MSSRTTTAMTPSYPDLYATAKAYVKDRATRWPSAYASGRLVQMYTRLVRQRYGPRARPYTQPKKNAKKAPLTRWFRERWVDVLTKKPCGSVKTNGYYPVCRPEKIATKLTESEIADAVARKQRAKERTAHYPSYFRKSRGDA